MNLKEENLAYLNEGIDLLNQLPDSEFKKNKLQQFLELKAAWENKDGDQLLLASAKVVQKAFEDAARGIDSNTRKAKEKNTLLSHSWTQSLTDIRNPERPINKYTNPVARKAKKAEYAADLNDLTKAELLKLAASLMLQKEIDSDWQLALTDEASFLRTNFLESLERRAAKGANTSASLAHRYKGNDDVLNQIYEIAEVEAKSKGLTCPTFPHFKRKVQELKIKPAFIKKPRLTAEERRLPKVDQEFELEQKKREGFAESTIRSFYESRSGHKATTKKFQ